MQTFLPYADYGMSARALDYRRLGKQRVEGLQILNALQGLSKGWTQHPAARMWENHERHLLTYIAEVCSEWTLRGYQDTVMSKLPPLSRFKRSGAPWWLHNAALHASHRSNLLRKDPTFYAQYQWTEPPTLPYWWPTEHTKKAA